MIGTMRKVIYFLSFLASCLLMGCQENIDDSNFAIKTEMTAADFVDADDNYSMIGAIFRRVRTGSDEETSSIYGMLSTRGNYTVFLPTNSAVKQFLQENGLNSIEQLNYEQASLVAKSCIIDNMGESAYSTPVFPVKGSFSLPNLNDRLLSCELDENAEYLINAKSRLLSADNEVSNGCIHVVDYVVAPSSRTLNKMIATTPNLKIFSKLLEVTTWGDSLQKNLDISYEDPDRPENAVIAELNRYYVPHRYYGYTAFTEPDSVFKVKWGIELVLDKDGNISNWDDIYKIIRQKCETVYGKEYPEQPEHPDNAVNRFVAYHLIDAKVSYNRIVQHYNEFGYKFGEANHPQVVNCPTNIWDFYTSMGKHRGILKITQVGDGGFERDMDHKMYINRFSIYADGPNDDFRELGIVDGFRGIMLSPFNGEYDNNALNGFYYPIDDILMYTAAVREELYRRRLRIDFNTILPELLSNNVRCSRHSAFEIGYFDHITRESSGTQLLYSKADAPGDWWCYQGDYFLLSGQYDATIQLPPIPKDGTYELRMAVVHNPTRGMCQIYFGDDPDRLLPVGLPYDMRQTPGPDNPAMPWMEETDDPQTNQEIDKNLRNQGYMKGPRYYTVGNGKGDTPVRSRSRSMRRIITVADLKADKVYYIRFKSALKKLDSQCQLDAIEFASSYVYNGVKAEDVW